MRKELSEEDSIIIKGNEFNGKEFSYHELTRFLTERVQYKKQLETAIGTAAGDVHE